MDNESFAPPVLASRPAPLPTPAPVGSSLVPLPSFPPTPAPIAPGPTNVSGSPMVVTSAGGHGQVTTDRREPNTAAIVISWIATFLLLGYMLPWAIAATRGKSNQAAIGVVNLLVGWTVIGWIAALVMACQAHQTVSGPTTVVVSNGSALHQVADPSTAPGAGWFPAPDGNGRQYWDGMRWTGHRAP